MPRDVATADNAGATGSCNVALIHVCSSGPAHRCKRDIDQRASFRFVCYETMERDCLNITAPRHPLVPFTASWLFLLSLSAFTIDRRCGPLERLTSLQMTRRLWRDHAAHFHVLDC